jgi:hypothetical protein
MIAATLVGMANHPAPPLVISEFWRRRFEADRLAGLRDAPRPGREPTYGRAERDQVIALTLEPPPDGTTHWSARRMAARTGISITGGPEGRGSIPD